MRVAAGPPLPATHNLKFTDTHCHLDLQAFDLDREAVLKRAFEAGVSRLLIPALDLASSRRILALAASHASVFAAVGIHPTETSGISDGTLEDLNDLASNPRVVAVGEIGLDYYWVADQANRARQRTALEKLLELARQADRPAIIHLREAGDAADGSCATDLLAILKTWLAGLRAENHQLSSSPGVLHSFAGSLQTAQRAVDLGFYIGVTGPVTYKNAAARRQVIGGLPLDRLLLETDSPFLSPVPHRGKRNEPAFLTHIADKIAEIQSRTVPEVARATEANASRLFAWGETV